MLTNREIRLRAGVSVASLARFLDIHEGNVWRMERSNSIPATPRGRKYGMALQIMENHGMVNYVPCPTVLRLTEYKKWK